LAINHPDVPFYIVGSNGNDLNDIPKNVIFKGWVDHQEMKKYQREIPIFIRLTEHDGFSLSVLEAFAFGAEVIWTQPHELVHHISSNLFEVAFENAHQKILENEFKPNLNNINYIKDNFQKLDVLNKLIKKMENVFG
jgi:glycosyltransferase involved in cell wall biosynthesis